MSGPLAGVTVLEIGHSVAGPYAGMVLAGLGADVVKLEPPGGDPARDWGPPFTGAHASAFAAVNRGKRSVVVDLSRPAAQEGAREWILRHADVVLQNLRAGALDKLGLGAEGLRAMKPALIVANLGAFGAVGPDRDAPGYDPIIQAASGLMGLLGEPDAPPARIPVSAMDMTTGMWAAIGILAALRTRELTGEGCIIDTSLYETGLAMMATPIAGYLASGNVPARSGSRHPSIVPTQAFQTSDGWVMVAVGNDAQFARLAAALGRTDLAEDDRFATNGGRVLHRDILVPILAEEIRTRSPSAMVALLQSSGVPCGLVRDVAQVAECAQTNALGMLQTDPGENTALVALPLSFDGTRLSFPRGTPLLDADSARVGMVHS